MTLRDYLDREGLTLQAFASKIGCEHPRTVERYTKGQVPKPTMMERIIEATGGEVTPNDFFDLSHEVPSTDTDSAAESGKADEVSACGAAA